MLSIKQGGTKYHFLNFCYHSTWDWNPVSQTIGKQYPLSQSQSTGAVEYTDCISSVR